ncbi:MAG: porin family protein [Bacteroidota bacterium]
MKNIYLCFFFLLLLKPSSQLTAQAIAYGFKGGLNLSTIKGDLEESTFKPGMNAGIFGRFDISEAAKFQPELLFSMQGTGLEARDEAKLNFNYIMLPCVFKIFAGENGVNLQVGLQIGYLLKGEFVDGTDNFTIDDQVTTIDVAGIIGFGYDFGDFGIDFRYNVGLNSTAKNLVLELPSRTL